MTPEQKAQMLKIPEIRDLYAACKEPAMREAVLEILDEISKRGSCEW